MVRDLEATLEVEAARGGGTTGEATTVLDSVPRSQRRLNGGRRISGAGIAMGLLGIGLIAAALIFGGDRLENLGGEKDGSNEVRLSEKEAAEFDPSPGDGRETGHQALAVDGNPTGSAWETEHYDTEDFGGIKDGVGHIVGVAGEPVTATEMEIRAATAGWDAEIYATDGELPDDLAGWGTPIGSVGDGGTRETVPLDSGAASSFLIWITKPPESGEQPGRFQMQISDIRVTA
jgi:serine/threonine-protein kinase